MSSSIFRGILVITLIVFGIGMALTVSILYSYYTKVSWSELESASRLVAAGVEAEGEEYFTHLRVPDTRVTLIDADGTVLYDNQADASEMENHRSREEVREAMQNGIGRAQRYSRTLSEKTYYYARRLSNGCVVRVSVTQDSVLQLVLNMAEPILIVVILAIFLSLALGYWLSMRIVKPINSMDLQQPTQNVPYKELRPLLERVEKQYEYIEQEVLSKEAMRREFSANVSHELKTPLTSISGTAEIMQSGMVPQEDIPHFAGNIYKESQRLITLVEDIMKVSQLDENNVTKEKELVNLAETARAEVTEQRITARKRHISVVLDVPASNAPQPVVFGVPQILRELVQNLVDNAIKYNKDNGEVRVRVYLDDGMTVLSVSDTGIGIPKADQDRVFERFYRVDKSHSKEIGGTGLGLSIVKHAAQYHDASIDLQSELGVGTTITVTFPNARDQYRASEASRKTREEAEKYREKELNESRDKNSKGPGEAAGKTEAGELPLTEADGQSGPLETSGKEEEGSGNEAGLHKSNGNNEDGIAAPKNRKSRKKEKK